MKILISIIFLIISALSLTGCGDCNLVQAEFPCRIREATITKFDPRLVTEIIGNDTLVNPVPTYSIHTYTFPSDNSSSGLLSNDTRYDQDRFLEQYFTVESRRYSSGGTQLEARLVSLYPPNRSIIGDIMVISVDTTQLPMTANLRFYGKLARFPEDFLSEDAFKFCNEYLPNYRENDENYNNLSNSASSRGSALPNAENFTFSEDDIIIVNENGRDVSSVYKSSLDPAIKNELLANSQSSAIDIEVSPGEVYFYKARNGKEFAMIIADIRQGTFEPYLRRVTIKFSEIRGQTSKECPTQ